MIIFTGFVEIFKSLIIKAKSLGNTIFFITHRKSISIQIDKIVQEYKVKKKRRPLLRNKLCK